MALRLNNFIFSRLRPLLSARQIATSKNNNETAVASGSRECNKPQPVELPKNWISYGFEKKDQALDRKYMHLLFFVTVTMGIIGTMYAWCYAPDLNLKDWAQREAYVELRRREAAGLPPIDRNLINPALVTLPSDEELGDTEIII